MKLIFLLLKWQYFFFLVYENVFHSLYAILYDFSHNIIQYYQFWKD